MLLSEFHYFYKSRNVFHKCIIKDNEPSKFKLEKLKKEQEEKRKIFFESYNNKKDKNKFKNENSLMLSKKSSIEIKKINNPPKKILETYSENIRFKNNTATKESKKIKG